MTEARTPDEVKAEVLEVAQELYRKGLVEGTSGNVSGRMPGGETVCITPSSVAYLPMTIDDLVVIDLDGEVVDGERSPSSEKGLHLACYQAFPEVGGVIHSHPVYATMFALAREPVPAVIEEFVVFVGGDVPCAEYATTGTDAVGEELVKHLADRSAALIANHGMCSIGATAERALHTALVVERSAQIVWGARLLGKVHDIPDEVNTNFAGVYRWMRENGM
ncbi:MAG: class II aldolase/adducin family protein [Actinobacteria bacterium]|nr:class II aldolase/adducin family protein [Actinomycetota bacterium]